MSISVIIPTYNRSEEVIRSIVSVQNESLDDYEIIVVDDGSTDDTQDRISRITPTVRYLQQENQGPSTARNLGLQVASGDVIYFLDSDDIVISGGLKHLVKAITTPGSAPIVHGMAEFEGGGRWAKKRTKTRLKGNAFDRILYSNPLPIGTFLLRRNITNHWFDPDLDLYEDWDFLLHLAANNEFDNIPSCVVKIHLAHFSRNWSRDYQKVIDSIDYIYAKLQNDPQYFRLVQNRESALFANRHLQAGYHIMLTGGDPRLALFQFSSAVKASPSFLRTYRGLLRGLVYLLVSKDQD